ncbi:hypothetical protein [Rhizobium sp. G21]|uniref:hypothetical protein n=1 Tax=Rhizobium sp. G21 TaxID=2758439 RepID=UPI0016017764|nr:hypothetical protein [Rhizobium sp. G21]MBB1247473.1 hypothetical protein [Rhizobium sp. G21]
MAQQPTYNDGTVTVGAGGTTVIGVGTQFNVYPRVGDYFWAQGRSVRIAAIANATQLTLAYGWPGEAITNGNYEIIYTPAQQVAQAKTTALLGQLSNGNLSSIAALTTAANKLAYYSAQGVAALADFSAFGRTLLDDADAAAARTTLGLVLTSSTTDTTAGRVVKVADFGIGTPLTAASGVDFSSYSTSASFVHNPSTSNVPADLPGSGESWYGFSVNTLGGARGAQLLVGHNSGRMFCRGHVGGTYGSWYESVDTTRSQTLTNKKLDDATTTIIDNSDATKIGKFELSGVSTGTTRTLTWPNTSGAIMLREAFETLTGLKTKTLSNSTTTTQYDSWTPTDYGAGKPALGVVKKSTADLWALELWDGASIAGTIMVNSGSFRATGAYSTTTASAANANIASDGTVARSTSSEQYKTGIEPMSDEWADTILDMEPIYYRSTCEIDNSAWSWWGLSAEAVAEIDPRLVHWRTHQIVHEPRQVERIETEQYIERVETHYEPQLNEAGQPLDLPEYRAVEVPIYGTREVTRIETVVETTAVPLETPVPEGVAYERLTCHLISVAKRENANARRGCRSRRNSPTSPPVWRRWRSD